MEDLKAEDIGPWSEVKLEIIQKYAAAYSQILSAQRRPSLEHVYIDAFAGSGIHVSRTTGKFVLGSPLNALMVEPPFKHHYFIDLDGTKVDQLKSLAGKRGDSSFYQGDCNPILLEEIFPHVQYEQYKRGLCLLDPYGMHLQWEVIQAAGRMGTIDLFLNFPIYDMNINVFRRDSEKADLAHIDRMNRYWGNDSWRQVAYNTQENLFGFPMKEQNEKVAEGFRRRLIEVAQFKYVPSPLPMKNKNNSVIYYLFFASQKPAGEKIVEDIFDKFRKG
ncbi:MAG: three-Cys-motif partner protein TcmP [Actinobacteria bacterium]|nr:three-Cys-motif partner protein TcmP [Actinomycetota bacterium]